MMIARQHDRRQKHTAANETAGYRMTTPALVKSADLKRMAAIVAKTGLRVEIEVDGKIIRVAPDIPVIHSPAHPVKKERIRL